MTILSTQNLIINDKFSATHKHLFYRSLLLGLNRAGEWAIFFLQRETRLKSNLEIFITRLSFQVEKTKIPAPILSFRSFDEKSTFLQHFECLVSLIWLATALLCRINWWGALKLWCLLFFALSLWALKIACSWLFSWYCWREIPLRIWVDLLMVQ